MLTAVASARVPPLHARTARSRFAASSRHRVHDSDMYTRRVPQRKTWTAEAMANAVEAVQSGACSVRRAAEQYNVPR